ncbi:MULTISPECIES: DUF72 domain-containing protein [Chryseobacterium]|uniref:Uncharacterized protein YecE (DUF72 family) n=1 Tax=Chryseobacterium camelliae TaxID=1265445 RepID=A0ABU0TG56_9FLAO|nr:MULTISPECIES: DUF72 domain-containing protein [Chryseobacterium]MDQ1096034.1 uncharacterized protein YecE (DUF72 family) [Chryseobacterium camelliae]MDQ1099970.1 uncharacterized protein YecE (DUF72 family) [Chryseobacterium sp. SORGH_AS_1048]MDR6087316.1 uncharacterized protein YecE (DUF72 family) [Chryseobacterium sp. SORGH_AS_0909]MDT3406164.1 uncharacterized protein YecE (DUF72 family) [Pseudacidovorax intermedius]
MKKDHLYIGCSGFYNTDWKGVLYPADATNKDFLSLYSKTFNAVEINSTFYRKPTLKTLQKWADDTPDEFSFFIKIPKTITHVARLENCDNEIRDFCSHIYGGLKDKLAGFLYQFPPSFSNTPENMGLIIKTIDHNYLNAVEFRHESWWTDEVFKTMAAHKIVVSGVSFPGNLPEEVISNHPEVLYYRLHGKPVLYKSEYPETFLRNLADEIKLHNKKTFIFFNNTWGSAAIHNALYLKKITG